MNLCVLSCAYEKPELAAILAESCKLFGLPLMMCEAAELNGVWPASGDMRLGKLVAALEGLKLIQETKAYSHALWADGFDTFVQVNEGVIANRWRSLGDPPLILSAEKNCWPDEHYRDRYPQVKSEYRFINAGTWMGQVGYLVDVLSQMVEIHEPNDQRTWTQFYLDGLLPGSLIDSRRIIFQTAWGASEEELNFCGSAVFHYNGGVWRNPLDTRMKNHWESVKASCGR